MAKKIVTPAQKQTAAQFKAEAAKAAAKPAQLSKGEQATIAAVGAAVQGKPAPAPAGAGTTNGKPNKAPKAAKAPKDPKAAPAPKPPRPTRPAGMPDHYTMSGNKKHQCNGPQAWSPVFLAAAKAAALPGGQVREGDGVRLALAIGVAELAKRHGIKLDGAVAK